MGARGLFQWPEELQWPEEHEWPEELQWTEEHGTARHLSNRGLPIVLQPRTTVQAGERPVVVEPMATGRWARRSPVQPWRDLTRWDLLGMVAAFAFTLVLTAILDHGRLLWEDEMLGWMLLRDPSWHHMVQAWKMGADGGGFAFYVTARVWLRLMGGSELAFRLYSATCFGLALAAMWAALRRFYSTPVVAFALVNTWFFSPPLTYHMREGRFYGLLILCVALAFSLAVVLADVPKPTPARFYFALFLVHAVLTTSHLLGVVFSAFLLGATVLLDVMDRRSRPLLYVSGAAGWLLLLLERANIVASARVGKPHFWTVAPDWKELCKPYFAWSQEIRYTVLILGALLAWTLWRSRPGWKDVLRRAYARRRPMYVVTGVMLLIPVAFLVEGLAGTWLYNDRYLLPVAIATACVTAEGVELVRCNLKLDAPARRPGMVKGAAWAGLALYVGLLLVWDFHHVVEFTPASRDYTGRINAMLPRGVPVVCEDAFTFTELVRQRQTQGVAYTYVLDWEHSIAPTAPRLEVMQYHLMENWRTVGYFPDAIEPIGDFLRENRVFFVVGMGLSVPSTVEPEIGNPLGARLARDPGYEVRMYGQFDREGLRRDTIWLVCRGRCGTIPQPGQPATAG